MTSEEIKAKYSMRDILAKYGIQPNRSGFICCPFHKGDREASMKIYGDSYYCFGCGASGDIFSFVERMEGCGFKDAFYALGGRMKSPHLSQTWQGTGWSRSVPKRRKWKPGSARSVS